MTGITILIVEDEQNVNCFSTVQVILKCRYKIYFIAVLGKAKFQNIGYFCSASTNNIFLSSIQSVCIRQFNKLNLS